MNDGSKPDSSPLLQMQNISKSFPGVRALADVSLQLHAGEVLGLVGENGAGKSTLIKVLGGAHRPDSGRILINGESARINSPTDAQHVGIAVIYQEFNLIPDLTVRENIFLAREQTSMGFIRAAEEHRRTVELFDKIGIELDPAARCRDLTVAQQQIVEIAKALCVNSRIIVMDEPTATLTTQETERLFAVIDDLKSHGLGIIYISHRLEEIFEVADNVMVLRDGEQAGAAGVGDITRNRLIEMMVGRPVESEFPRRKSHPGPERLRVENLSRGDAVIGCSFDVRSGEILGFAGLVGSGRTEIMRLIFGADRSDTGDIFIDGRKVDIHCPGDAIRNGICLLTEDRKSQGLVLIHSCRENYGLPNLDRLTRAGFVDQRRESREFDDFRQSLDIRTSGGAQPAMNLSGGNQQKVVLAKWLARGADIMIFDEPTRGIDVGAKYEIYLLMNKLADQGKAVIMISSELPEIIGLSDRIVVMHEGRIKGIISDTANATQKDILSMAIAEHAGSPS